MFYTVYVERVASQWAAIVVEADDEDEAKGKALAAANRQYEEEWSTTHKTTNVTSLHECAKPEWWG